MKRRKLPPLLNQKQVAEIIGVSTHNMPHTRKTKGFPEPAGYVGGKPIWFEEDILDYKIKRIEKLSKRKGSGKSELF